MGVTRIGLLGGSFDPVHVAHIALADTARQFLGLDQVQLIPAANPWQRQPLKASAPHRLRMLELAIAGHPALAINPVEIERGGAPYTADTVRALPGGPQYFWLLGTDQLQNFCTWRDWQDIAARIELAVATRPGASIAPPAELAAWLAAHRRQLHELPFAPMAVSASDIRQRLAAGAATDGLLPEPVAAYIATHHLYR